MFLDMACFFRGYPKIHVLRILDSYNIGAECGLDVLIDKSLVFISGDNKLEMPDLIEYMGRYVVKKIQKDLGEPTRIWDVEDFEKVMLNNTETKAMESIWLRDDSIKKLRFSKEVMKNMERLKLLYINEFDTHDAIEYLPNSLCWIEIFGYPWELLPEKFEPKRLVHLELQEGLLRHLWFETKHFPCLRTLDLRSSQNLMQTPDFSGMPNLEHLDLGLCRSLKELFRAAFVKFESLPEEIGDLEHLEELDSRWTLISRPPYSIVRLNKLKFLSFGKNISAKGVLFVFRRVNEGLRSLEILNLSYCNLIYGELLDDI
ncbi:TMV resistance protein N [Capsicum baccatum]|uniref:TMV resistance protein N n=1 Tax=Capsicum baccatum TaxID=33114 RepID=A0A2G2VE27_CAPBA|nr:TMV resistance protein N [Capsicum baccatum]